MNKVFRSVTKSKVATKVNKAVSRTNIVTARAKLSVMEKKINWLLVELETAGVKIRGPKRIIEKNSVVLDLGYGKKFKVTTTGRVNTTPDVKESSFGRKLLSLNKVFNRENPRDAAILETGPEPELNRGYKPAPVEEPQPAAEPVAEPVASPQRGWTPEKRAMQAQRMRERQARWAQERQNAQQSTPQATRAPRVQMEEPVMRRGGVGDFSVDYKRASQRYSGPQSGMDFDVGTRAIPRGLQDIEFNPDSPGAGPAREARRQRAFMDQYANLDDNRIVDDGGYGEYASSKKVRRIKLQ